MTDIAKSLIVIGVLCIMIGGLFLLFQKVSWFGKLPGDILIKRDNFTFYFPITTCVLISIFLSLVLYFWNNR